MLFLFGTIEHRLITLWCKPWSMMGKTSFRRRIRIALSSSRFPMFVPWLLGLLNPIYGFAFSGPPLDMIALGCLIGYVGLSLLAFPFQLGKKLRNFREELAVHAALKLVKVGDITWAETLLLQAAQSPQEALRMAATAGLKEVGTRAGEDMLAMLCSDRSTRVSVAAMKAYGNLLKVIRAKEVLSLAPLANLLVQYEREKKTAQFKEGWDNFKSFSKIGKLVQEIDRIIYSQLPLRRAFPHVFCYQCHVFGKMNGHGDWRWVSCPVCLEARHLRAGVQKVIGTIGAPTDWELEDGTLRVSLWNRTTQKAVYADIEAIEILQDTVMNTDWAVGAVVEMLTNQHGKTAKQVQVTFVGKPKLSKNSIHLLKTIDPTLSGSRHPSQA
ncbi:MAG TPA: hypothetical protein VHS96_09820 [Bacteroidia bacterium]|nr:hypothetical protein [Bacteroidia bacterium]